MEERFNSAPGCYTLYAANCMAVIGGRYNVGFPKDGQIKIHTFDEEPIFVNLGSVVGQTIFGLAKYAHDRDKLYGEVVEDIKNLCYKHNCEEHDDSW